MMRPTLWIEPLEERAAPAAGTSTEQLEAETRRVSQLIAPPQTPLPAVHLLDGAHAAPAEFRLPVDAAFVPAADDAVPDDDLAASALSEWYVEPPGDVPLG